MENVTLKNIKNYFYQHLYRYLIVQDKKILFTEVQTTILGLYLQFEYKDHYTVLFIDANITPRNKYISVYEELGIYIQKELYRWADEIDKNKLFNLKWE
ncbi:hypothetical protein [Staphylococcus phage PMBT8]|nr:hypothetical protein [Staphylococcus phage PMBT8]